MIHGLRLSKAGDSSAPVYGKIYYDSLKVEFRDEDDPLSIIELEKDETVRALLLKAMVSTKKRTRDFTLIIVEFVKNEDHNESEWFGVISWAHTLNPANGDHFPYLLGVMRWLNNGDYATKFSEKMEILKPWMDDVFFRASQNAKQVKVTPTRFLELHAGICAMVLRSHVPWP